MRLSLLKPRTLWGRPVSFRAEGHVDTLNFERTSSLRSQVQALACHLQTHDSRHRLSYEWALRDLLPRRHLTVPYAYDASLRYVISRGCVRASCCCRFVWSAVLGWDD